MELAGFGQSLFSSEDLDPVYTTLLRTELPRRQLARWLISYWCFYHAGFASLSSEYSGLEFWKILGVAAKNDKLAPNGLRWPRGSERRHFRGAQATVTIQELRKRYMKQPEDMIDFIADGPLDVKSVIDRAKTHPMFGNWLGFKVADMLDAVLGIEVGQDDVSVFLYDTPRQSILEHLPRLPINRKLSEDKQLVAAMRWLQKRLSRCRIPHKKHQHPDWFSLETVWCKHLSHMHGHYPVGKDIREIRHGLEPWVSSKTAKVFLSNMPPNPKSIDELF